MSGVRVVPGAEAFRTEGGPMGFLLLHGFTGNPSSLRSFGDLLASRGASVSCPRLPGHGTTWQDLAETRWEDWEGEAERGLDYLTERCADVFAVGLSMGGAMAIHLGVKHWERVAGVVAINPYVFNPQLLASGLVRYFVKSVKGIGNDIKKPGGDELPYERVPLAGAYQLGRFIRLVAKELPSMRLPFLLFNSPEDHVVPKGTAEKIWNRIGTTDKERVVLRDSYHVATLDHDAEAIFAKTLDWARARASAAAEGGG